MTHAAPTPKAPMPSPRSSVKSLFAGGLILLMVGLVLDIQGLKSFISNPAAFARTPLSTPAMESLSSTCTSDITESAQLSREQLLALLAVPERDSKSRIREIAQEPYCTLSTLNIRAGVEAEREAYPLAFDPNTTLVILYENDEYAGYRFKH
ncbi:MAG: hypothetical protein AAFR58_09635 [Cyanobacteria bacterium J06627_28]